MSNRENDDLKRIQREQDAIRRADQARQILENPAINEAWEAIETLTIQQLAETALDGGSQRNEYVLELVRVLQANRRQKRLFEIYVQTGSLVSLQVEGRDSLDPTIQRH